MNRPPVARWVNTDLPEPLARALASTAAQPEAATLSRMREQLQSSIGPAFDSQVPGHSAAHALVLLKRGKWLAASALVTAGLAFFATRSAIGSPEPAAPARVSASPAPLTAAPATVPQPPAATIPQLTAAGDRSPPPPERKRPRPAPSAAAQPGLAEELKGVERIRQELEASPAKGLAAAVEQQRMFAHGVLAPERELLRIEALLRLGRVSEARARAARARSASGDQPYRDQIQKLLSTAERP